MNKVADVCNETIADAKHTICVLCQRKNYIISTCRVVGLLKRVIIIDGRHRNSQLAGSSAAPLHYFCG